MSEKSDKSNEPSNIDDSIPNWLNRDLIELQLRNHLNDQKIQIVQFEIRSASAAKGENYGSRMYRMKVTLSPETNRSDRNLNLIVKIPVLDESALAVILAYNAYKKEIEFYGQIAPKIAAVQAQLNETKPLIPKCYGVCWTNDVLVLDDLAIESYRTSDQSYQFDQAKLVLERLASFHAINAVLQQQQANIFENFKYGT